MAEAMDTYLKGDGFPDDRIDAAEAIDAIAKAGGISVYAHPLGGERERRLTREELSPRVEALRRLGLGGLECYYSRYSSEDSALLSELAEERGLLKSAGSDYHGKNKTVELGRLSSDSDSGSVDATVLSALPDIYTL
jgi:predicted metal-dependent phosphoesterase TrpH